MIFGGECRIKRCHFSIKGLKPYQRLYPHRPEQIYNNFDSGVTELECSSLITDNYKILSTMKSLISRYKTIKEKLIIPLFLLKACKTIDIRPSFYQADEMLSQKLFTKLYSSTNCNCSINNYPTNYEDQKHF